MASIFTKIVNGEIPSHKIYEDQKTLAFLDINPVVEGQALVIPKQEVDRLWQLDEETYRAVMETTKKLANHMRSVLQCERVGIVVEGFEVPHAHVRVYPLNHGMTETLNTPALATTQDELAQTAEKLKLDE